MKWKDSQNLFPFSSSQWQLPSAVRKHKKVLSGVFALSRGKDCAVFVSVLIFFDDPPQVILISINV
jgi:hypothetical protein